MKLKEKINHSINQMNRDELVLLYEHIKLFTEIRKVLHKKMESISIDEILDMTSSSKTNWADAVLHERVESQ